MVCLNRPYHFTFFKGCLPKVLPALFLNTLSQVKFVTPYRITTLREFKAGKAKTES